MSHVTEFKDVEITSLPALVRALEMFCPELEIVQGTHYRTYKDDNNGQLVGDWPLPEGVTAEMIGNNATHVIRFTDAALARLYPGKQRYDFYMPYEIGVVPNAQRTGHYLATDFWQQGHGILDKTNVGQYDGKTAFGNLYAYYRMAEDAIAAAENGDSISFKEVGDHWEATIETAARLGY